MFIRRTTPKRRKFGECDCQDKNWDMSEGRSCMNIFSLSADELSAPEMECASWCRRRALIATVLLILAGGASAGGLEAQYPPSSADSAMYRLEDLYNRLADGSEGQKRTGGFAEPTTGPASTLYTLDQIMVLMPVVDNSAGAAQDSVLAGKTFWGLLASGGWGLKIGAMVNVGQQDITPSTVEQAIQAGYHNGSGRVAGDADLVASNIASGVAIFGVPGAAVVASGTALDTDVLTGKTFSNDSGANISGAMVNVGQQSITPGTSPQGITQGYHNGTGSVAGDANLVSGYIKKGTAIFGVTGTYESPPCNCNNGTVWNAANGGQRWCDNGDGTVTDLLGATVLNKTKGRCLVWLKDAGWASQGGYFDMPWYQAHTTAGTLISGEAGLSDGSLEGDWRLPVMGELRALTNGIEPITLDSPGPFIFIRYGYWSSTTAASDVSHAWEEFLNQDYWSNEWKGMEFFVWPVRGG